jgi:hypothetical protein
MYFLINNTKKIIFGWSAKSGCTHVKHLFCYYSNIQIKKGIHVTCKFLSLPKNHENYTVIIFVRNPYKRLVSGFLDKHKLITCPDHTKTFQFLINQLYQNKWELVDPSGNGHHFRPHLSEAYQTNLNIHFVYDIENIDYYKLNELFGVIAPDSIKNFRGHHILQYSKDIDNQEKKMWIVPAKRIGSIKPNYKMFYNQDLANKVESIYKKDFELFEQHGIKFYLY